MSSCGEIFLQRHFDGKTLRSSILAQPNKPGLIVLTLCDDALHSLILLWLSFAC